MARITWQNVAAPDISPALARAAGGGLTVAASLDSIGNLFHNADARKKAAGDLEFGEKLLGLQSVSDFDAAVAGGNIFGALGADRNNISANALAMAAGRRDSLEEDRTTDQAHIESVFDHGQAVHNWGRTVRDQGRDDAAYDLQKEADQQVWDVMNRSDNPAEGFVKLRNDTSDPERMAAIERAIAAQGGSAFETTGAPIQSQAANEIGTTLTNHFDEQQRELTFKANANPAVQLMLEVTNSDSGYPSSLPGLISELQAEVGDENDEAFGQGKGTVTKIFNELQELYPGVGDNVIAAVLGNSLRQSNFRRLGAEDLNLHVGRARQQLDLVKDEEARQHALNEATQLTNQRGALTSAQEQMGNLIENIRLYESRDDTAENRAAIARFEKQLQDLHTSLVPIPEPEVEDAAAALAAAVTEGAGAGAAVAGTTPQVGAVPGQPAMPVDPNIRSDVAAVNQGLGAIGGFVGTGLDQIAAGSYTTPGGMLDPAVRAAGYGIGVFNEGLGSSILNWADDQSARRVDLGQQGLLSSVLADREGSDGAPSPAAQAAAAEAQESLPETTSQTLQELGEAAGLSPDHVTGVAQAAAVLNDPDASRSDKARAQQMLSMFLNEVGRNSDMLSDELIQKLANPEQWLNPG